MEVQVSQEKEESRLSYTMVRAHVQCDNAQA